MQTQGMSKHCVHNNFACSCPAVQAHGMSKHLVQQLVDVVVMHMALAIGVATSITDAAWSVTAGILGIAGGGASGIAVTSSIFLVVELVGCWLLGAAGGCLKRLSCSCLFCCTRCCILFA